MKKQKQNYLTVKWITEVPKDKGILDAPFFISKGEWSFDDEMEAREDMSDEQYEKTLDYIFELFSRPSPLERFYHSMNMGCWGE